MTNTPSVGNDLLVAREEIDAAFNKALRLFVGRGSSRRYQYKQLAKGTGIDARMLEAYATQNPTDYRRPTLEAIFTLAKFLGGDFTAELIGFIGQGAYDLPEDDGTPPGAIAADMSDDAARVTRMAIEGVPSSHPDLRAIGRREMARGAAMYRRAA